MTAKLVKLEFCLLVSYCRYLIMQNARSGKAVVFCARYAIDEQQLSKELPQPSCKRCAETAPLPT